MWVLLSLRADAACTWTVSAADFGERSITLGGDDARLLPVPEGSAVQADARLVLDGAPALEVTFTDARVVLTARLALDDDHPMILVDETLQYGTFGTLPPGAAVQIVGEGSSGVTVVPASVAAGEVAFPHPERTLPCATLTPSPPVPRAEPPAQPADRQTRFDMERAFTLHTSPQRDGEVTLTPGPSPMRLTRIADDDGMLRLEYRDRYVASWSGYSRASALNAYNHGRHRIGTAYAHRGLRMGAGPPSHRCDQRTPLLVGDVVVGHIQAGSAVDVFFRGEQPSTTVPWLDEDLTLGTLDGCTAIP